MGSALSFERLATVAASTKRTGQSGGRETGLVVKLASVKVLALMPVDAETRRRLGLETPHEVFETAADGSLDIKEGDHLVIGAQEYPVRSVAEWPWGDATYLRIIVEALKNA